MGVDYGYSIGYGIKVPEEVIKKWWVDQGHDEDEFWGPEAIEELRFPEGLNFDTVGNLMNGTVTILICLSEYSSHFDLYEMDDQVHFFNDIVPEFDEDKLLRDFVRDTFGIDEAPGSYAGGLIS